LFNFLAEKDHEMDISFEDFKHCRIFTYPAVFPVLPEDSTITMDQPCYAAQSFHGTPKNDNIQISHPNNTKWYAQLLLNFSIEWKEHNFNLSYVQEYNYVNNNNPRPLPFNQPWLFLTQNTTLINVDSIDGWIQMIPDFSKLGQFYCNKSIHLSYCVYN